MVEILWVGFLEDFLNFPHIGSQQRVSAFLLTAKIVKACAYTKLDEAVGIAVAASRSLLKGF